MKPENILQRYLRWQKRWRQLEGYWPRVVLGMLALALAFGIVMLLDLAYTPSFFLLLGLSWGIEQLLFGLRAYTFLKHRNPKDL